MTADSTAYVFWMVAAACAVVALAFVLPTFLSRRGNAGAGGAAGKPARRDINIAVYRDQLHEIEAERAQGMLPDGAFEAARQDIEARLAEDALAVADAPTAGKGARGLGYALIAVLPAAAFGLYFWLGNPGAINAVAQEVSGEHDVMAMIQKVEEKTRQDPNDVVAWSMLAKTYAVVGHWPEALAAYQKAYALKPDMPAIMTGYAEALAINNNRELKGEPMRLVLQALEKDPDDLKGLELAGIHAFQEKNYAKAAFYMKHLLKLLPPDSPYAQDVLKAQKEANRLSRQAMTGLDDLADPGPAANAGATVKGRVELAPELKARVAPGDVVFLFARGQESGPPAAALRARADAFPLDFELNDSMAMNPDNRLSSHATVNLTARVAKSGDVKGQAGDLEGRVDNVKVGATDVRLVIDRVRP